jgi:hypothetical protein
VGLRAFKDSDLETFGAGAVDLKALALAGCRHLRRVVMRMGSVVLPGE